MIEPKLEVPVELRDLAEKTIEQAERAFRMFFDAASKYNPDKQVAFSSYAKHRIKGAILDSLVFGAGDRLHDPSRRVFTGGPTVRSAARGRRRSSPPGPGRRPAR